MNPETAKRWERDRERILAELQPELPIRPEDIPNFKEWITWHPFSIHNTEFFGLPHPGYDFAAYMTTDGKCMFGLLEGTPVRASIDGTVINGGDVAGISVTSGGITTGYGHVGYALGRKVYEVQKGDIIGYVKEFRVDNFYSLQHLHFACALKPYMWKDYIDPETFLPLDAKIRTDKKGYFPFEVIGTEQQREIIVQGRLPIKANKFMIR